MNSDDDEVGDYRPNHWYYNFWTGYRVLLLNPPTEIKILWMSETGGAEICGEDVWHRWNMFEEKETDKWI